MNESQKIVKYLAIALAAVLIVGIISAMIFGLFIAGNIFGLIKYDDAVTADLKTISTSISDIEDIDIELMATSLQIKTGDDFKVETNNQKITFEEHNGKIKIKEENRKVFKLHKNYESSLIIYIPEDVDYIKSVKIKTGAGRLAINSLNTKKMKLELGAGQTEIKNSAIENMDADVGAGEFIFEGIIKGNSKIDAGVGAIKLHLTDGLDEYKFKVNKGIGSVTIDGKRAEDDKIYGDGDNYIEINGGIGSIEIE